METIEFGSATHNVRGVTLDIDAAAIRQLLADLGIEADGVPFPLTLLSKGLLLDLDVRDRSGNAHPICSSAQDSTAAQLISVAALEAAGGDVTALTENCLLQIWHIAHDMPTDSQRLSISSYCASPTPTRSTMPPYLISRIVDARDFAGWRSALTAPENNEFRRLLSAYSVSFNPRLMLALKSDVAVVKYRSLEVPPQPPVKTIGQALGLQALQTLIEVPSVGTAQREHFRVQAPDGMFCANLELILPLEYELPPDRADTPHYEWRVTHDRAAAYTRGFARGRYWLLATLRPSLRGFLRSARLSVLSSLVLLFAGFLAELLSHKLSDYRTASESAVTILLAIPAVSSAFLARGNEHELLSDYLRVPRLLLASSTSFAIAAGAIVTVHMSHMKIWVSWLALSFLNALVLSVLWRVGHNSHADFLRVRDSVNSTGFLDLAPLPRDN